MPIVTKLYRVLSILVVLSMLFVFIAPAAAASHSSAGEASFIVQGRDAESVARIVEWYGGQVTSLLPVVNGVAATLDQEAVAALSAGTALVQIFPNGAVELSDVNQSAAYAGIPESDYGDVVGADKVWFPENPAVSGVNGKGVTVAVVDTGFANMTGLAKDINGNNGRVKAFVDFVTPGNSAMSDPNGHGSHVASIIANTDKGIDGEWNGVAPGVNLVGVRVLDANGAGTYEQVLQGIQWVVANRAKYNIKVMNLSLSAEVRSPYWADPINQAVMQAWAAGITVVAAAGNQGSDPLSVSVPGNNPYVITVGAFTDNYTPRDWSDDYLAPFSASGPTYDGFVKPDLVAPGAHMNALMMPSSTLSLEHQANRVDSQYFSMAGTSQATAVVSGVAALVAAKHPALTPDQIKARLMGTAFVWLNDAGQPLYAMWRQGAGRVNAYDAVFAPFPGDPAANTGLNIQADLAGTAHYEGCTGFDAATSTFFIKDVCLSGMTAEQLGVWAGQLGVWAGDYSGVWAGQLGVWAGQLGVWAGQYGVWAGQLGVWAGDYSGVWAGQLGVWAGDYMGVWAGQLGVWAGDYSGVWAGQLGVWAGQLGVWAGQLGVWAGQYGVWAGQLGVWAGTTGAYDPSAPPVSGSTLMQAVQWVDGP